MTTITAQASEDDLEKIEQQIDWIERLEGIRSQRDKELALRETLGYVDRLRAAVMALAGDTSPTQIAARHGSEVATMVNSLTDSDDVDAWARYLLPAHLS